MKKMKHAIFLFFILIPSLLLASSGDRDYLNSHINYTFQTPTGNNTPVEDPLDGVKSVPFSDPVHIDGKIEVVERKSQIKQFKCTQCHKGHIPKGTPNPHTHIKLSHGSNKALNCFDCHSKKNRDVLTSFQSRKISFNQSAKLCYQCHSTQYKDWTKGSHGKRVGNWTGKRVIYSCTQCHDPHQPGFDSRMPKAIPSIRGAE